MNDLITSQKYLDGELSKAEKETFEIKLLHDSDLIDDLLILNEIDRILTDSDTPEFEKKVKGLINSIEPNNDFFSKIINFTASAKYYIAASVAILIGVFLYNIYIINKPVNEKLFAEYYVKYDPDIINRSGSSTENKFSSALNLYMHKDYDKALNLLSEISFSPENTEYIKLYSGLCYMELNEFSSAIKSFQSIDKPNSAIYIHAQWYEALAFLKLNNINKATEIFNEIKEQGGYYAKSASEILNSLAN